MKKLLATALAASLALSASTAFAGGPVIIDDTEVVAEPTSSVGILPILLIGVVLCAVICDGGDDQRG